MNYSVLMSVFWKENANFLNTAIQSIVDQTVKTNDFVIICDGPLGKEKNKILREFSCKYPYIKIFRNKKNLGLGVSLNKGISLCKNNIIMRMDSDDYSLPNRAEEQLKIISEGYDITSSYVGEFVSDYRIPEYLKKIPITNQDILKFVKKRNPFNHPAVMFLKDKVIECGNYSDIKYRQDYELWIRMLGNGCVAKNIPIPLVNMRIGNGMIERRFTKDTVACDKYVRKQLFKYNFINKFEYLCLSLGYKIVYILPISIKKIFYKRITRKAYDK